MDVAKNLASFDKIITEGTLRELKDYKSQSFLTQSKRGEALAAMLLASEKQFNIMGNEIIELHTEENVIKNTIGDFDRKCLIESRE